MSSILIDFSAAQRIKALRENTIHSYSFSKPSLKNLPPSSIKALEDLYNSTRGNYWIWKNESYGDVWNFDQIDVNPCQQNWQGIQCNCVSNQSYCELIELSLDNYNLTGLLPQSIGSFDQINQFTLSHGRIYGTIPTSIGNLVQVRKLQIYHQLIEGTIPSSIGNLKQLQVLSLEFNLLTGSIPEGIYKCNKLKTLLLGHNFLNGTISSSITNLQLLDSLVISTNRIGGPLPYDFSSLKNLTSLSLDNNYFNESFPAVLLEMPYLKNLNLARNHFFSSIPGSLFLMKSLQELVLSINSFSGKLPEGLYNSTSLTEIDFSDNFLSGTLSNRISNLINLRSIDLGINHLNGSLPASLFLMSTLKQISLHDNDFSGNLAKFDYSNLINLETFTLTANKFTGPLPSGMVKMPYIRAVFLDFNYLTGSIPTDFGLFKNLEILGIAANKLNGSLPDSLFNCTSLLQLDISGNYFTGTLSERVSGLSSLKLMLFGENNFTGTLPNSMFNMTSLTQISLYNNQLSGHLDHFNYSKLINLKVFTVLANKFTGTLPRSIVEAPSLQTLQLDFNQMTGTIPHEYGQFPSLQILGIAGNLIHGQIPNFVGTDNPIVCLFLYENYLSGTLPESLGYMKQLTTIEVYKNSLEGNISGVIGLMSKSFILNFESNQLTGRLEVSQWPILTYFTVFNNYFSGPIAHLLADSYSLIYADFGYNYFSGSVPPLFGSTHCPFLQYLYCNRNMLTGTIPTNQITKGNALLELTLNNNFLHGTVPPQLALSPLLSFLYLYNNMLTGTYPAELSRLPVLNQIFLQNNKLTGPISNVFNASAQLMITNIDVSGNAFSGSLPSNLNRLTSLSSFAASSNCLTGSISSEICELPSLTSLALDGISSASECRIDLFSRVTFFNTFILQKTISGGIPACLFQMPSLQSLHLSGNGLTGTLPDAWNLSSSLNELVASYNQLTGTIPLNIQNREWKSLSLSYNKFYGVLSHNIPVYAPSDQLSLSNNRLSGPITQSLTFAQNISILEGNLFSCPSSHSSMPVNDPDASKYSCGSSATNASIIAWIIALFVAIVLLLIGLKIRVLRPLSEAETTKCSEEKPKEELTEDEIPLAVAGELTMYQRVLNFRRDIVLWRQQFAPENRISRLQQTSELIFLAKFLRNVRAIFVALTLFIMIILMPVYICISHTENIYSYKYIWQIAGVLCAGIVSAALFFVGFTTLNFILLLLTDMMIFKVHKKWESEKDKSKEESRSSELNLNQYPGFRYAYRVKLAIALLNFIFMILVDAALIDVVISYPSSKVILAQITLAVIKLLWNEAALWQSLPFFRKLITRYNATSSDQEVPNWTHYKMTKLDINFILSLVLFNNIFIPILAVAVVSSNCLYNAFFSSQPIASEYSYRVCTEVVVVEREKYCVSSFLKTESTSFTPPYTYSYECSSHLIISYASVYVFMFTIIGVILPISRILLKFIADRYGDKYPLLLLLLPHPLRPLKDHDPLQGPLFESHRLVVRINAYLAILMSFGAIFPPLALIICFSVLIVCYWEEVLIGRLLFLAGQKDIGWYRKRLEMESEGVAESFVQTIYFVAPFACVILAYIVYDILGDSVGWKTGTIVGICLLLEPLAFRVVNGGISGTFIRTNTQQRPISIYNMVELMKLNVWSKYSCTQPMADQCGSIAENPILRESHDMEQMKVHNLEARPLPALPLC